MSSEFTGKDLVINWLWSGGTLALTAEYKTFSWTPSQDKYETTTSNDLNKTYITGLKDFTASFNAYHLTGGTALEDALAIGTQGTLIVQPEGTATGKRKLTFPVFTTNDPVTSYAYNALAEINASFQGNGAWTETTN